VRVLADRGAEVHCAANATQALDIACRMTPRVLVSDIGMPGEDGFALIQRLREKGFSAKTLPAIAVSALARDEDRQQGMAAGYQYYFAKPVDVEGIVQAVVSVTERSAVGS
jgi:CheY-like chemotaxis protein